MMNIVKFPNPILREKIPDFDFNNPTEDPKSLVNEMLAYMYLNNGIGLAANQVGKNVRMFVIGNKEDPENVSSKNK